LASTQTAGLSVSGPVSWFVMETSQIGLFSKLSPIFTPLFQGFVELLIIEITVEIHIPPRLAKVWEKYLCKYQE
jgi:hypothetical protein